MSEKPTNVKDNNDSTSSRPLVNGKKRDQDTASRHPTIVVPAGTIPEQVRDWIDQLGYQTQYNAVSGNTELLAPDGGVTIVNNDNAGVLRARFAECRKKDGKAVTMVGRDAMRDILTAYGQEVRSYNPFHDCADAMRAAHKQASKQERRGAVTTLRKILDPIGFKTSAEMIELGNEVVACALINAYRRMRRAGVKVDNMPILQGGQGIGKTTFWELLFKAFLDAPASAAQMTRRCGLFRSVESMRDQTTFLRRCEGAAVVAIQEFRQRDAEAFKELVTQREDTYDHKYRDARTVDRVFCLVATANIDCLPPDDTGQRRYHVVKLGEEMPAMDYGKMQEYFHGIAKQIRIGVVELVDCQKHDGQLSGIYSLAAAEVAGQSERVDPLDAERLEKILAEDRFANSTNGLQMSEIADTWDARNYPQRNWNQFGALLRHLGWGKKPTGKTRQKRWVRVNLLGEPL